MQNNLDRIEMRDAFIYKLFEFAKADKNIIFLSNDFGAISLDIFRSELSGQFINAGISEQNIVSVAAGLALEGKKVFIYSIASFISLRCLEQIKIDICVMKLPVVILAVGAGFAYGVDGPTHHAVEDISVIRSLSNIQILNPSDSLLAQNIVEICINSSEAVYVRLDKGIFPNLSLSNYIGDGYRKFGEGKECCIVSTGNMVHTAVKSAASIGMQKVTVIDIFNFKFNGKLLDILRTFNHIITIEEHSVRGGFGSMLLESLNDKKYKGDIYILGIQEYNLYCYGKREYLQEINGINVDALSDKIKSLIC